MIDTIEWIELEEFHINQNRYELVHHLDVISGRETKFYLKEIRIFEDPNIAFT